MPSLSSITLSDSYLRGQVTNASFRRKTLEMTRLAFDLIAAPNPDAFQSVISDDCTLSGYEILRHTLRQNPSYLDVNARLTESGDTLLHAFGLSTDPSGLLQDLIAHGADVNARNNEGDSAINLSIGGSNNSLAFDLIASGASLVRPNHAGNTVINMMEEYHAYATLMDLVNLHDYVLRVDQHMEEANALFYHYETSGDWHDLTKEELLKLATIDKHWQAFTPTFWQGFEQKAVGLISSLPPFLQQELLPQLGLLQQKTDASTPLPMIEGWSAERAGTTEHPSKQNIRHA